MKTEKYICDIKGCEKEAENKSTNIQVIFTTEQNEGRSVAPHLANVTIDICKCCLDKVLKGNYIFASGAQGHNEYLLKK
jgi:hypothetical protein